MNVNEHPVTSLLKYWRCTRKIGVQVNFYGCKGVISIQILFMGRKSKAVSIHLLDRHAIYFTNTPPKMPNLVSGK